MKALAKKIAWPFLEVNPSHFLNEGLERIYVRADEVFEWSRTHGTGYLAVVAGFRKAHVLALRGAPAEAGALAAEFLLAARHIGERYAAYHGTATEWTASISANAVAATAAGARDRRHGPHVRE